MVLVNAYQQSGYFIFFCFNKSLDGFFFSRWPSRKIVFGFLTLVVLLAYVVPRRGLFKFLLPFFVFEEFLRRFNGLEFFIVYVYFKKLTSTLRLFIFNAKTERKKQRNV